MKGLGQIKRSEFIAMLETVVDSQTAIKVTTKLEEELFVPVGTVVKTIGGYHFK